MDKGFCILKIKSDHGTELKNGGLKLFSESNSIFQISLHRKYLKIWTYEKRK